MNDSLVVQKSLSAGVLLQRETSAMGPLYSCNLKQLGDDGRVALLALSLFTPSATREASAQVAGFGDDLKRMNEAVRRLAW
jgi:hypothetical protein